MRAMHPGRILRRELNARSLSANALALALRTPSGRITDILNEKRAVSVETAMRLGRYFGQSPRFWLNLQMIYDLKLAEEAVGAAIDSEVAPA
ncbi:MAG TPA: HigA family addiction module antitoxin [Methylocystis sp.]|nr:HigA family addiction module antitoxin [Methylocystis sp.]